VSIAAELVMRFIAFKDGRSETYGYMVSKEGDLWDGALVAWADARELELKNTRERGAVEAIKHPNDMRPATPKQDGRAGHGDDSASRRGSPTQHVRGTSLEAYRALRASGKLGAQQLAIVGYFIDRPGASASRQELARDLGIGINAVCGRVVELLTAAPPILAERGRKVCQVTRNDVLALELA
jgi:hypothetical protein